MTWESSALYDTGNNQYRIYKSSTENHLQQLGYVSHLDVWLPFFVFKQILMSNKSGYFTRKKGMQEIVEEVKLATTNCIKCEFSSKLMPCILVNKFLV